MKTLLSLLLIAAGAFAQTASYPNALATDATLFKAANNVSTTLLAAQASTDTVAIVASSTGIVPNMLMTVCPVSNTGGCTTAGEIEVVCLVSGNTLTLGYNGACPSIAGRGFDSTVAAPHTAGSLVSVNYVGWHRNVDRAEIEAIENTLGTNLANIPASPQTNSASYDYSPYGCSSLAVCAPQGATGLSLIIGNNTVTMSPLPTGVSGAHTATAGLPQSVYISGGTGTAEACPITGGSGSQIIINCANTHSGAWSAQSAGSGIPEAIYVAGANGAVRIPAGNWPLYATVTVPDAWSTSVRGSGQWSTILQTASTTADGILYAYVSVGGMVDTGDYTIEDLNGVAHTAGTMVHVRYRPYGLVSNIWASNCYDCYWMERNNNAIWQNTSGVSYHFGFRISCGSAVFPACQNEGTVYGGHLINQAASGQNIHIDAPTTGLKIFGMFTEDGTGSTGAASIAMVASGTQPFNEITISSNVLDGMIDSINYTGNNSSCASNNIQIVDNEMDPGNSAGYGAFLSATACNINLIANRIGSPYRGILLDNTVNVTIQGNGDISAAGDSAIVLQDTNTGLRISGNKIGGQNAPADGLSLGGTLTGATITENTINYSSGPLNSSATITNLSWWGNTAGASFPLASFTACGAHVVGQTAPISDSTTNTWGATITGSGSDPVLGYCDGTNWTVAAK
jgi:hypothetical protein